MEIKKIQSEENKQFKRWKKLQSKKGRSKQGVFLIEGEHLVKEAQLSGLTMEAVLIKENACDELYQEFREYVPVYELHTSLFKQLTDTETPQGIAALVEIPKNSLEEILAKNVENETFLLLDEIQDPGNLGTLIRSADANKVKGIFLGKGTVDPYNSKVIRSAMGSVFRIPLFQVDLEEVILRLKKQGVIIIGTSPRASSFVFEYPFPEKSAILLGNEGKGVHPTFYQFIDHNVKVPMQGNTESLNVSITGSILLYEQLRQQLSL